MNNRLAIALILTALVLGGTIGGLLVDRIKVCPEVPDNAHLIDSLEQALIQSDVRINEVTASAQLWEEEAKLARETRKSVKHFPAYEKAAYDSGLDNLYDSLGQMPRD